METVSFPENIDWHLLFVAEAWYYKEKSWRVIDGSIQPGESKPAVFGAAKPARHGGKFSPFLNCPSLLPEFSAQERITVK